MTTARAVSIALCLLIGGAIYFWLDHERNDLLLTTRSIIGQVRKGGDQVAESLYIRRRFPEGDPEGQRQVFDPLIGAIFRDEVASAEYGESGKKKIPGAVGPLPWRDVIVTQKRGGSFTVQWVKYQNNWYIYDFRD